MRIFVYGTLMRGMGNHYLLMNSRFIGQGEAPGLLFTGPGFPMAVPTDGKWVKGEVFEVNDALTLRKLDWLEGHPDMYERTEIKLRDGSEASIYYWKWRTLGLTPVRSGDWKEHRAKN